jgi:hypothetical protein
MTVLILARDLDANANDMVTALHERGTAVYRVNMFLCRCRADHHEADGREHDF